MRLLALVLMLAHCATSTTATATKTVRVCPELPSDFRFVLEDGEEELVVYPTHWEAQVEGPPRARTGQQITDAALVTDLFCELYDAKLLQLPGQQCETQRSVQATFDDRTITLPACDPVVEGLVDRLRARWVVPLTPRRDPSFQRLPSSADCSAPDDFEVRERAYTPRDPQPYDFHLRPDRAFEYRGFGRGVAPQELVDTFACALMTYDFERFPIDERGRLAFCPHERYGPAAPSETPPPSEMDITLSGRRYEILIDFCTHAHPGDALTRFAVDVRPFITEPEPRYAEYLRTGRWPRSNERPTPREHIAETPSETALRFRVTEGVRSVHRNCTAQQAGMARVVLLFGSDGNVRDVQILEAPRAMRDCIRSQLRAIELPPFSAATFRQELSFAFRARE